jgi:hypothetical protein
MARYTHVILIILILSSVVWAPGKVDVNNSVVVDIGDLGGTVGDDGVANIGNSQIGLEGAPAKTKISKGSGDNDLAINGKEAKGLEGEVKSNGNINVKKADKLEIPTDLGGDVKISGVNNGVLSGDGTTSVESAEAGTLTTPDIVTRSISSETPTTETSFQDAQDLVIHPDGNWEAGFMKQVEITRPRFQEFLDDNQNIRRRVLPVKSTSLSSAVNVRFENGTLIADKVDRIVIDGAESTNVFDLSMGSAELDVEIPQEYVNMPALSFASAQQITVGDYQYNNIIDGKFVIVDNTILFSELRSGAFDNQMVFPNPIPSSTSEVRTSLDKNAQLLYLIKTIQIKERKLLKELVMEQLTESEKIALLRDYDRKIGGRSGPPTETIFRYLQDGYKRFTINLLPLPTAKIQIIKNAFDEFYNNQDLQDDIYSLLTPEEQDAMATKYVELKNYDLNLGSYSLNERKAFVYLVAQQGSIEGFLQQISGVRRDVLREVESKLIEKVIERPAKQMNLVVDGSTVIEFVEGDVVKIKGTATGEGKIFVTEADPVQYSLTNEIVEYIGGDFTDQITSERSASTTEIDLRVGMECMVLSPEAAFTYTDDDLEKSFQVESPHFYSLCVKRDESQVINEELLCSNCGFVNTLNKTKVLNGFVSYRRLIDNGYSDVYTSYSEENRGVFSMDDSMSDVNFLTLQSTGDEEVLASTLSGGYLIQETPRGTQISVGTNGGQYVKGYVSSDGVIGLDKSRGVLEHTDHIQLGDGQAFFTKLLGMLNNYYTNGETFEALE